MPQMRTSFKGLVRLLAKSLYPEANVFIRELIQNAHDSIQIRRKVQNSHLAGQIDVMIDAGNRTITFTDNGMGMDKADIEEFLSTIGSTGTGAMREELAKKDVAIDTIGQFGIGLLSGFVVAERIDVYTQKAGDDNGWHWVNHGNEDYELAETDDAPAPGTRVVVTVGTDYLRHIDEKEVRDTIKRYADFLPFKIMLNGNGPINVIDAPWHKTAWSGEADYRGALQRFLNERYPDTALHVIPIDMTAPRAKGALYVSNQHVPLESTTGVVDIFQNRMCIRLNDQELLPDWAKFIRGVVDSPDLQPTAARDNVMKDDVYFRLRKALGELIIKAMIDLATNNIRKFNRICDWHHWHLKGMAARNDEFFNAIIDYLPFETNQGSLNMKQYIGRQSAEPGQKVPVYFFSYGLDSNQFYEICKAKGLIALNTGRNYDETLVRKYVERHSGRLELKQLDNLDDPDLYLRLTDEEHRPFLPLESAMRRALEEADVGRVRPATRRFAPATMSGVLLQTHKIEAYDKMEAILREPFMIEGLGELAEEVTEQMRQRPLDLFINADNSLIQTLRDLDDIDDPRHHPILVGVYNNAILYSQQRMTPENARIFYHQYQHLMLDVLERERELKKVRKEKEALQVSVVEAAGQEPEQDRDWVRLFVMMPYDEAFRKLEDALRAILEFPPYCFELKLARDVVRDQQLKNNLIRHINDADGYIADITTHSPNVMMELGWVHFDPDFTHRPLVILNAKENGDALKGMPADISDRIHLGYSSLKSERMKDELKDELERNEPFQELRGKGRKRFLSAKLLEECPALPRNDDWKAILKTYRTVEDLLEADDSSFRERLEVAGIGKMAYLLTPLKDHLNAV